MNPILVFLDDVKPTWRLLLALLVPVLLLAVSAFLSAFLWLIPLALLGIGYFLWRDWQQTMDENGFSLYREHREKMSIGVYYPITLTVHNSTLHVVDMEVEDSPPRRFDVRKRSRNGRSPRTQFHATILPEQSQAFTYHIRPTYRGDHPFGQVRIRWVSVFGFFSRERFVEVPTQIKVYPNLLKIRQENKNLKPGQRIESGARAARHIGGSGEFEQLRDYLPDDDYRRISWRATARHGKPITMEFTPERSQNIILTVDISRKMMTRPLGVMRTTRLDLIINAVLFFSYVALARGDRVGVMTFGSKVEKYVPPRSGQGQLAVIIEALYNARAQPVDPGYAQALSYLHAQRQRRSLILLLTDPHKDEVIETLVPYLSAFYPHHLPLCVTLSDPNIIGAAKRAPYSLDTIYQRAVAEQILDERRYWRNLLEQRGVMTLDVPAYHLTAAVLNKYLEIKDKARI